MGYNAFKLGIPTFREGGNPAAIFSSGQRISDSYTFYCILKLRIRGEFSRYVEIGVGKEAVIVSFKVKYGCLFGCCRLGKDFDQL